MYNTSATRGVSYNQQGWQVHPWDERFHAQVLPQISYEARYIIPPTFLPCSLFPSPIYLFSRPHSITLDLILIYLFFLSYYFQTDFPVHDATAVMAVAHPEIFTDNQLMHVDIETKGELTRFDSPPVPLSSCPAVPSPLLLFSLLSFPSPSLSISLFIIVYRGMMVRYPFSDRYGNKANIKLLKGVDLQTYFSLFRTAIATLPYLTSPLPFPPLPSSRKQSDV